MDHDAEESMTGDPEISVQEIRDFILSIPYPDMIIDQMIKTFYEKLDSGLFRRGGGTTLNFNWFWETLYISVRCYSEDDLYGCRRPWLILSRAFERKLKDSPYPDFKIISLEDAGVYDSVRYLGLAESDWRTSTKLHVDIFVLDRLAPLWDARYGDYFYCVGNSRSPGNFATLTAVTFH